MVEAKKKETKKTLEIDFAKMDEGTCRVEMSPTGDKWAVCKDEGKIKIYTIKNDKEEK